MSPRDNPLLAIVQPPKGKTATGLDAELRAMLVDWPTFWANDTADADWLAEPVLAAGRAHAIYAPGGTGKSLFALWLAAQMATGGRGLNGERLRPVRVLYLDYEMTHDDVYERLESMGFGPDSDLTNLSYAILPSLPPADAPEGGKAISRLAALVDAEIVFLDTFSRAVAGDENDADTVRSFYRWTGIHLKGAGRAFARIDHAGKDLEKGQRGSSAKNDDVDIVWQMVKADGGFTLTAKKRRMGWVPETVALSQNDDPLRYSIFGGMQWPADTGPVAKLLADLGVPVKSGYRQAADALAGAGHVYTRTAIRAAVKFRKYQASTTLRDSPENSARTESGQSAPWRTSAHPGSEVVGAVNGAPTAQFAKDQVTGSAQCSAHLGAVDPSKDGAAAISDSGAARTEPAHPEDDGDGMFS